MKAKKLLVAVFGCLFLISCSSGYEGYEETGTGLYYRFYVENATRHVPENDEIISIVMSIQTEKDSIVQEAKQMKIAMQKPKFRGDIFEALSLMHEGDSASFIINAKQYYNMYHYGQVPSFVKDDKTMLWFTVKIDTIMSIEEYQSFVNRTRYEKEINDIVTYMQQNNIMASPLSSGLYYVETKVGQGSTPQKGQSCTVNYTGKLLDGTIFDSSVGRGPYSFQLGVGQVIQGWEEGIALMKKNGSATLIIPSYLAYGERDMGNIPPNSPLVFEIELMDIK
ncbi:MAG: FKBP-type peptidyl-prolyl cis-trans isomerase [Bacteroidales bacterium]|jgi:FKBP-type peptidyl-prolyl cis-trans isomerase|nr:FKBP-type peptidyl-prolyl cis-trans isomerase [Bacteroidales bacterium]